MDLVEIIIIIVQVTKQNAEHQDWHKQVMIFTHFRMKT